MDEALKRAIRRETVKQAEVLDDIAEYPVYVANADGSTNEALTLDIYVTYPAGNFPARFRGYQVVRRSAGRLVRLCPVRMLPVSEVSYAQQIDEIWAKPGGRQLLLVLGKAAEEGELDGMANAQLRQMYKQIAKTGHLPDYLEDIEERFEVGEDMAYRIEKLPDSGPIAPRAEVNANSLVDLLLSLFSSSELRRFVRFGFDAEGRAIDMALPGRTASPAAVATAVVEQMEKRGLIGPALWHRLKEARPYRISDIDRVARGG